MAAWWRRQAQFQAENQGWFVSPMPLAPVVVPAIWEMDRHAISATSIFASGGGCCRSPGCGAHGEGANLSGAPGNARRTVWRRRHYGRGCATDGWTAADLIKTTLPG